MRNDILDRKDDILKWIDANQSKAFMCRKLNCKPETLNSCLIKMDIQYSGNQPGKGIKSDPKRKTALEYLESTCIKSHLLRLKLIEDGIKKHMCESCNRVKWMGKPISLELHHIDGNHYNNTIENLELVCPNCHSYK